MTPSDTSGQRRERGHEAHEDDPTGIRALLASLPDPGPMPDDLVERIGARLAVEQAHREQGGATSFAARSDSVIDLAAERSHRRPGRTVALMGAAAAGLLVATMALGEFAGIGPASGPAFDSAAQVPSRAGAGSDSGGAEADNGGDQGGSAGAVEDQETGAGDEARDGGVAGGPDSDEPGDASGGDDGVDILTDDLATEVTVLPALGPVGADDFDERIVDLADGAGSPAGAAGGLTAAGAEACWLTAGPAQPWPSLHAAQAELDGERVVVLLGRRDADTGEAYVLPWACTVGDDVAPVASATLAP